VKSIQAAEALHCIWRIEGLQNNCRPFSAPLGAGRPAFAGFYRFRAAVKNILEDVFQ
jgi:hypothetical protein